jgi:hypothetical protein
VVFGFGWSKGRCKDAQRQEKGKLECNLMICKKIPHLSQIIALETSIWLSHLGNIPGIIMCVCFLYLCSPKAFCGLRRAKIDGFEQRKGKELIGKGSRGLFPPV